MQFLTLWFHLCLLYSDRPCLSRCPSYTAIFLVFPDAKSFINYAFKVNLFSQCTLNVRYCQVIWPPLVHCGAQVILFYFQFTKGSLVFTDASYVLAWHWISFASTAWLRATFWADWKTFLITLLFGFKALLSYLVFFSFLFWHPNLCTGPGIAKKFTPRLTNSSE